MPDAKLYWGLLAKVKYQVCHVRSFKILVYYSYMTNRNDPSIEQNILTANC